MSAAKNPPVQPSPLAIVGLACRFPRANDAGEYWVNVRDGIDAIREIPDSHWSAQDYFDGDPKKRDHTYGQRGGFLEPLDFDPLEFGIAPNAIEATDTSQLLAMVAARDALIDAGYGDTGKLDANGIGLGGTKAIDRDRVSVILGVTGTLELVIPLGARLGHPLWRRALEDAGVDPDTADDVVARIADGYVDWQEASFPGLLGNVVAGRVANRLDLGGTNCVVDAACASSLSALHLAALELESGRSDVVVTGGVDTFNDIFMYMCFSKTPALSPSGHARPFAKDGDGTTLGEGVGVVVLKRLDDAERDGDRVYAVIKGIGSASDGKGNAIYAPASDGQAKALRRAYDHAGVTPASIELVEAHGTGTAVGDATEVRGLTSVYGRPTERGSWCAIGSVKSQIGHTKAAAGIAGLIKAALALHHQVLPPTIKVDTPLDELRTGASPFYVNADKRPWLGHPDHPRRAGVSAFGFGGSNFHCVLEESPQPSFAPVFDGTVELVALSASSPAQLREQLQPWQAARELDWSTLRSRAAETRRQFRRDASCRLVLPIDRENTNIANLVRGALALLESRSEALYWATPEGAAYGSGPCEGKLGAIFPGQGAQYVGMLRDFACAFPEFREVLASADLSYWNVDAPDASSRLSDTVYPRPAFGEAERDEQTRHLRATERAQPAIGSVTAGALSVLRRFGFDADAFAGHSYGELVALFAAGRLTDAAFHQLSNFRGRLMAAGSDASSSMLAVQATEDEARAVLRRERLDLTIANKNAPRQTVLSGAKQDVELAVEYFERAGIRARELEVSAAFHSRFVSNAQKPFHDVLDKVKVTGGDRPVYANTTAEPYPTKPREARALLAGQLARPVEFVELIRRMHRDGVTTFVEIGPSSKLSGLIESILDGAKPRARVLSLDSSQGKRSGVVDLARLLASLAALGHTIDVTQWAPDVDLPSTDGSPKKKRFTVPITGANYVAPKEPRPPRTLERATSTPTSAPSDPPLASAARDPRPPALDSGMRPPDRGAPARAPTQTRSNPERTAATTTQTARTIPATPKETTVKRNPEPSPSPEAARLLSESLAALRDLQSETADIHRQFLEGQRRAQDNFVRLVEEQQRVANGLPAATQNAPRTSPAAPTHAPLATPTQPPPTSVAPVEASPTPVADPVVPEAIRRRTQPTASAPVAPPETVASISSTPSQPATPALDPAVVLDIVAEKTGYPTEMLELGMELEADLGIDSIKRVEILSAVQERVPAARSVEADELGRLVTLGDVVGVLNADTGDSLATAPPIAADADHGLVDVLLEVVAEKTGYPTEMLDLDMELEADLGIDSIKRVEILSGVQDRQPNAPAVSAEDLGRLSTLRQITEYLGAAGGAPVSTESTPSPSSTVSPPDASALTTTLLEVVAEKTGYPTEMLDVDMELEADLGIDSIKRVEILSALQEQRPDLPPVDAEVLGQLRTLASVIDHFRSADPAEASSRPFEGAVETSATATVSTASVTNDPTIARTLERLVPRPTPIDRSDLTDAVAAGGTLVILGHDDATALGVEFEARGYRVDHRVASESIDSLPEDLRGVIVLGDENLTTLRGALAIATAASSTLEAPTLDGPGQCFVTISRLGGQFGFDEVDADDHRSGGLTGLTKTARREWLECSCRALDVPAKLDASLVTAIVDECLAAGPAELGIAADGTRTTIELVSTDWPNGDELPLAAGETVVVTGGARGVTAEACVALARRVPVHFEIIGRSETPGDEDESLHDARSDAEVKRAILAGSDRKLSPRELASEARRVFAAREMRSTFARLRETGATVTYTSVDVSSAAATTAFVRQLTTPVRGVIHGAGVLRDHRIADKTLAEFDAVYSTKVDGIEALLDTIDHAELRLVAFFSSTTARLGRIGQVDYAMANEVLNKLAQKIRRRSAGEIRVVSFGWGPWDGGMVTPSLRTLFEREGVGLIPLTEGAEFFVNELAAPSEPVVEVVVMGGSPESSSTDRASTSDDSAMAPNSGRPPKLDPSLRSAWRTELSVESHPFLTDHQLDGKPVLPAAVMVEWMAQAVTHANPGLEFSGFDAFAVLRGVIVTRPIDLEVAVGQLERREGGAFVVASELRSAAGVHARGIVTLNASAAANEIRPNVAPDHVMSGTEIYDSVLFHGPHFRAISNVAAMSEAGMVLHHRVAPSPGEWLPNSSQRRWITEPLAIDVAFQAMIVWTWHHRDAHSLPSRFEQFRQFARWPSEGEVELTVRVDETRDHSARASFEWRTEDGTLLAQLTGYECTVDARLAAAFGVPGRA